MNRSKIVFIIPGFRQKINQNGYKELKIRLKKEGYKVIPIAIPWRESTIVDNVEHFLTLYKKRIQTFNNPSAEVYLLGFSYGALIAFLAATKIRVKGLILCSLSPFFKEDLPKSLPKQSSSLEIKRYQAFSSLRTSILAKKVKAKSVMMLYGEKESEKLIKRTKSTFRSVDIKNKYLFSIHNTQHEISSKKYINAIHFATSFL